MTLSENIRKSKSIPNRIELLSPAGSMESLVAAVAAGCDAVYLGGTLFSARAFAGNFDHVQMKEAIRYCHIRGVRVYVTMNTLLFEDEMAAAQKEVAFLYENDVDALLVQDLGLFHWIRSVYPDLSLHCSTQMHIHNADGVRFMKEQGAERVVIARESSLDTVRQCSKLGIDIEVFAYGAICVSYSGQCLMSQAMKNRSGNRGVCAQCCRLKYYPSDGQKRLDNPMGEYMLSPRDLNVIERLPEIIESGVASLKIEGRMKRPEYVWLVTNCFRKAINAYYEGREFHLSDQDRLDLLLMFNRQFSSGHLFSASTSERINPFRPNHIGIPVGTVIRYEDGRVFVKLSGPLYQHDGLRILNEPADTGLTAVRIEKNGMLVNHADKGDSVWLDCTSKPNPKKGQMLQKTTDSHLLKRIQDSIKDTERTIPIDLYYEMVPGQKMMIRATDPEGHRAVAYSAVNCEEARKAPLTSESVERLLVKLGGTPYRAEQIHGTLDHVFLAVRQINEARREVIEALDEQRATRNIRSGARPYTFIIDRKEAPSARLLIHSITSPEELPEGCEMVQNEPGTGYRFAPVIDEHCEWVPSERNVISHIGELSATGPYAITGMTMNCTNSYSAAFLLSQPSVHGVILSSELNMQATERMIRAFETRYGFIPAFYKLVYGRRTLMYIKNGISENCYRYLEDIQKNVYPLLYRKGTLEILEPVPYRDTNPLCYGSYLILTDEGPQEKSEMIKKAYEEIDNRI